MGIPPTERAGVNAFCEPGNAARAYDCGMADEESLAELYLNGRCVGTVRPIHGNSSWHFGEFEPLDSFGEFAALFGRWSLLMHADEDADRLTNAASEELREVEFEIDRLQAKLHFPQSGKWTELQQVNIDGDLIDWKS